MASEAVLLLRTFYEQGNPNGKFLFTIFTNRQNLPNFNEIGGGGT